MMVRWAQVREVVVICAVPELPVSCVVNFAAAGRPAAPGESARAVAHPQPGAKVGGDGITGPADGEHGAGLGVGKQPGKARCGCGEFERRSAIDGPVALEDCRLGRPAEQRQHRHCHKHAGANARRAAVSKRRVEQEFGERVSAQLRESATLGRSTLAHRNVGQPVVDTLRDGDGLVGANPGHAVSTGLQVDGSLLNCLKVPRVDGVRMRALAFRTRLALKLRHGERLGVNKHGSLEAADIARVERTRVLDEHLRVTPADCARAERREGGAKVREQRPTLGDKRLGGALRNTQGASELSHEHPSRSNLGAPPAARRTGALDHLAPLAGLIDQLSLGRRQ